MTEVGATGEGVGLAAAPRCGTQRRIAVVIPLEYHRGLAVACIRGWAREQDFPRDRYRVLVGAPAGFDATELELVRAQLQDGDALLMLDHSHDMTLVEDVARNADAELLLFSESHCVPQPDALSYLVGVADANPGWDAFSAPTHGLTNNLLSCIECDIYSKDIRGKLQSHDWLRVLDQCFVIRRAAYDAVGGFRGQFGHFAEWLFAATMKVLGLRLGVADRAVVKHGYIGDYEDLETFTVDFAYGQIKYLNEHSDEPAAALFPSIPELEEQTAFTADERAHLARYSSDDRARVLFIALRKWLHRDPVGPLKAYLNWASNAWRAAAAGPAQRLQHANRVAADARILLDQAIVSDDRPAAHRRFVEWFARLVQKGRYAYLAEQEELLATLAEGRAGNFARSGSWRAADGFSHARVCGVHDAEGTAAGTIRWTLPTFEVVLPLHAGKGRQVSLDWTPVRPLNKSELVRVRFDGRMLPASAIRFEPTRIVLDLEAAFTGWHELAVSVYPFRGGEDGRLFGLPLRAVNWLSDDGPARLAADGEVSRYFLHVHKCGGTTASIILGNGFAAADGFSPYGGAYYPADFLHHPARESRAPFYVGHFRWCVPAAFPPGAIRVSTMLRHPVDRLLSLFHYLRQHRRINPGLHFESWIRSGVRFRDTMTSQFIDSDDLDEGTGVEVTCATANAASSMALANLRRCVVVGIAECIDESVNLLANEMGFLPPERIARYNHTEERMAVSSLDPAFLAQLEHWFAADFALYSEARNLFEAQLNAMHLHLLGSASGSAADLRASLRRRHLERLALAATTDAGRKGYLWQAADVFHGENLHAREQDGSLLLRWTGPEAVTHVRLPIERVGSWDLEIRLHAAACRERLAVARLRVDGRPLVHVVTSLPNGQFAMAGRIDFDSDVNPLHDVPELTIDVPVARGNGEFRALGLPLLSIRVERSGAPLSSSRDPV